MLLKSSSSSSSAIELGCVLYPSRLAATDDKLAGAPLVELLTSLKRRRRRSCWLYETTLEVPETDWASVSLSVSPRACERTEPAYRGVAAPPPALPLALSLLLFMVLSADEEAAEMDGGPDVVVLVAKGVKCACVLKDATLAASRGMYDMGSCARSAPAPGPDAVVVEAAPLPAVAVPLAFAPALPCTSPYLHL